MHQWDTEMDVMETAVDAFLNMTVPIIRYCELKKSRPEVAPVWLKMSAPSESSLIKTGTVLCSRNGTTTN